MASGSQRRTRWERVAALELPPGSWDRAWAGLQRRDVLLRIGLCLATAVALCVVIRGWHPPFIYRTGQVLPRDVAARVPFEAVSRTKSEAKREEARRRVPYVYVNDPGDLDELVKSLINAVRGVVAAESLDAAVLHGWEEFRPLPEEPFLEAQSRERFEEFKRALASDEGLAGFRRSVDAGLASFRQRGMLLKLAQKPGQGRYDEIVVYPLGRHEPEARQTVKVGDVLIGQGAAIRAALERELKSPGVSGPVFAWLWRRIMETNPPFATLIWDEKETDRAMEAAVSAVGEVVESYQAGETVAVGRHPLSPDEVLALRREYEAFVAGRPLTERLGRASAVVALIVALFGLCAAYLFHRQRRLLVNLRQLGLILGMIVLAVVLSKYSAADALRAELIPFLLFGQIVAIASSRELALLLSGVVAIVLSLALGHGLSTLLLLGGVALATILQLDRIRSRSKLIYVGLSAGVVAVVLTLGLAVLESQPIGQALLVGAACNGLWTVAAGFVITGLLPFIEKVFGVLTDMSLLELGDVSHPLLQQLVQRAPSTYNHSITVGSIAEAAAEAIGARGLLVRVGAYYHDIGKMLNPEYFIENQPPDANLHESLLPAMSSLVIIAHVKDGADLARQHGLPSPIIDLIHQHHGTTLVAYFYDRANEQRLLDLNGAEVDESSYRYPGPKPQTRESGVLMLADSAESASRTLVDPTPARIENLVREVAETKLDDGQFDESGLSLRELRTIEKIMVKSLTAIYHGRVKYPESKPA
jgi:putative nucleotidyltransferase with HDIG domain